MNKLLVVVAWLLLGFSRLGAGECLPWQGLGGDQTPERAGVVEIRFRRAEAGDDRQRGYLFEYQLRNLHAARVAHVYIAFAWQNPQTLAWEDASRDHAVLVAVGPQSSSTPTLVRSPEATGIDHGARIEWQEAKAN